MTAQPHAHVRFRIAIERRALWLAEDAARELPNLPLSTPSNSSTSTRNVGRPSTRSSSSAPVPSSVVVPPTPTSPPCSRFAATANRRSCSFAAAPNAGPDRQAALLLANLPAVERDLIEGAIVVLEPDRVLLIGSIQNFKSGSVETVPADGEVAVARNTFSKELTDARPRGLQPEGAGGSRRALRRLDLYATQPGGRDGPGPFIEFVNA